MRSDVTLRRLDPELLRELLRTAVEDAAPEEVMPPVTGPAGWTSERRAAFLHYHESRSLPVQPREVTFAVLVGTKVVGAARLCPLEEQAGAVEAGLWIGRSQRGAGVGGAVLRHLLDQARADGFATVFVSTALSNVAVHRLIEALGVDLVRGGQVATAWIDLATQGR